MTKPPLEEQVRLRQRSAGMCADVPICRCADHARTPNLAADLALDFSASVPRLRGSAAVTSELMRALAEDATSSTARSKASSLAWDGTVKPLSFLTNWSDASRISSSVAGGSKLNNVLMFLHMVFRPPWLRFTDATTICGKRCSTLTRFSFPPKRYCQRRSLRPSSRLPITAPRDKPSAPASVSAGRCRSSHRSACRSPSPHFRGGRRYRRRAVPIVSPQSRHTPPDALGRSAALPGSFRHEKTPRALIL